MIIRVLYASIRGIVGRVVCRFETRFFFFFRALELENHWFYFESYQEHQRATLFVTKLTDISVTLQRRRFTKDLYHHTFRLRIWHVYYENSRTIFLRYTPFIPVKNGRDFRPQRPRKMINFEPKILLHAARQLRFLNWMLRRMEGELTIGLVKFVLA